MALILAIIGYSIMLYGLEAIQTDVISSVSKTGATVTDLVGIVFIFTPPANRWFSRNS